MPWPPQRRRSAPTPYDTLLQSFAIGELLEIELDPQDDWYLVRGDLIAAARRLQLAILFAPATDEQRVVDFVLCPRGWRATFLDCIRQGRSAATAANEAGIPAALPNTLRAWDPSFAAAWDAASAPASPVKPQQPPTAKPSTPKPQLDGLIATFGPGDIGEITLDPGEDWRATQVALSAAAGRRQLELIFFVAQGRHYFRVSAVRKQAEGQPARN